jgi:hypothetical protein
MANSGLEHMEQVYVYSMVYPSQVLLLNNLP